MASGAGFVTLLFFSLIFTSTVIGYLVTEMQISEVIEPVNMPQLGHGSFNQSQNFVTGAYDKNIFQKKGEWVNDLGLGIHPIESIDRFAWLLLQSLNFDNQNTITNRYIINNTGGNDYWIVVSYTAGSDQNIIIVKQNGFHITNDYYSYLDLDYEFIPYVDANKYIHPEITTTYKKDLDTVVFSFNGVSFESNKLKKEDSNPLNLFIRSYAGIGAQGAAKDFYLESFSSSNPIRAEGGSTDVLSYMWMLLQNIVALTLWTLPESIFPAILNILLIKSQVMGLVISVIYLIRG